MQKTIQIIIIGLLTILIGCKKEAPKVDFKPVQQYIVTQLDSAILLAKSIGEAKTKEDAIIQFVATRRAYKKAEPFAEYLNLQSAHRVNGPPLPVYREDNGKVLPSVSLQAIEEQLYGDEQLDSTLLNYRLYVLNGYLQNLKQMAETVEITPRRFFGPIHLQFMRVFALGITSFDTPTSLRGLEESKISLQTVRSVYQMSIADSVAFLDDSLHNKFLSDIAEAIKYLEDNSDFEEFNRYEFTRAHINPLTKDWVAIRKITGLYDDALEGAINLDAQTFFEANSFNVNSFRSNYNTNPTQEQIVVGKKLFFDPNLSSSGTLACSSCHIPEKAYQDGLKVGMDKDGNPLKRNTPTIINAAFQRKFFWDGRSDDLEQQINVVFANEKEFDQSSHSISLKVLEDSSYVNMLKKAYPDKKITKNQIVRALASYTSTLNAFDSKFDRNMRGEASDFTEQEIKGMNLFMGKALCATCHFMPLTNGTVPPGFAETEKEILGTPETAENKQVDDDLGFYWVFEEDIHKYMFKTPTIRNVEFTAPYMHNGVYNTLEEVMDFYNRGGGAGMGFELEHQTLPFDSLSLNDGEIKAIIAFMKTLSDPIENY